MALQVEVLIVAVLAAIPVYLLLRMPWRKHDKREWVLGAFWIYMFALGVLVFRGATIPAENYFETLGERIREGYMINLVPLRTIRGFFSIHGSDSYYVNIIGNIVMFIPLGFGLPLLWKRMHNFFRFNLTIMLVPVAIEFVQLFIWRSVDVDDVLLNFIGGAIGGVICAIVRLISRKSRDLAR